MKTIVIGDIHGGLIALKQVLERAKISTSDKLIFLGDFVDGWSQSPQVLDFLIDLKNTHNCIFIRGNHDELLCNWLTNNHENFDEKIWFKHGGEATILAYSNVDSDIKSKHIAYLKSLQNYYLDDKNRLFVHAGFTNIKGVDFEYYQKLFYWDRTLWETAI
jgi:serine/threonine protein phosphatase 1